MLDIVADLTCLKRKLIASRINTVVQFIFAISGLKFIRDGVVRVHLGAEFILNGRLHDTGFERWLQSGTRSR